MNHRIIALLMALTAIQAIHAQNSIDRLMERISEATKCTYSSIIERNPKTRQVEKVVKNLSVEGKYAKQFVETFRNESATGTFIENRDANTTTLTLTVETARTNRIYSLRVNNERSWPRTKVTIIVKVKQKKTP